MIIMIALQHWKYLSNYHYHIIISYYHMYHIKILSFYDHLKLIKGPDAPSGLGSNLAGPCWGWTTHRWDYLHIGDHVDNHFYNQPIIGEIIVNYYCVNILTMLILKEILITRIGRGGPVGFNKRGRGEISAPVCHSQYWSGPPAQYLAGKLQYRILLLLLLLLLSSSLLSLLLLLVVVVLLLLLMLVVVSNYFLCCRQQ